MNILWLSDSPMTVTGYATISWNICNKLVEAGHNVYYVAHNYIGQMIPAGMEIGEKDKIKRIKEAHSIKEKIKNAKLEILPKIGHNPHSETPGRLSEIILREII